MVRGMRAICKLFSRLFFLFLFLQDEASKASKASDYFVCDDDCRLKFGARLGGFAHHKG